MSLNPERQHESDKTHYADPDTLATLARLERENADLRAKLEAEHDIRADRETVITLLAGSLNVNAEPHQSFFDRLCEAAEEATKDAGVARAERDIYSARLDAAIKLIADILSALPPNAIKAPDGTVYEFNPPPEYAMKMLRAFKAGIDAAIAAGKGEK